jgi:hypothetical protein
VVTRVGQKASKSGKAVVNLYFKDDNGIVMGLKSMDRRAPINFANYMNRRAAEIETYMKQNHPWQNRTGRAEAGLHTEVINRGRDIIQINMLHSDIVWPWYGIYLEYSMGRRFAIIEPTQQFFGPKLLNELNLFELYRFTGNPKN